MNRIEELHVFRSLALDVAVKPARADTAKCLLQALPASAARQPTGRSVRFSQLTSGNALALLDSLETHELLLNELQGYYKKLLYTHKNNMSTVITKCYKKL